MSIKTMTIDKDVDSEANYFPALRMTVADPKGMPWNTNLVDLYPNEGKIDTDVDAYRRNEKNIVTTVAANGVKFSIIYSLERQQELESGLNIARTIWVIIVLSGAVVFFHSSTNRLVLDPL